MQAVVYRAWPDFWALKYNERFFFAGSSDFPFNFFVLERFSPAVLIFALVAALVRAVDCSPVFKCFISVSAEFRILFAFWREGDSLKKLRAIN